MHNIIMERKQSNRELKFLENRKDYKKEDITLESLYYQNVQNELLERIRKNTSFIVWYLVIQIILGIIFFLYATG